MPVYTEVTTPAAPTYSETRDFHAFLKINSADYLLINSSGDRLITLRREQGAQDDMYTVVNQPS